jgi:hypothetical protein
MGGACRSRGRDEGCIRNYGQKTLRKRPLGRYRLRWEGNIRKDLREIGWEIVDSIHLVQDRDQCWAVVNTVMNFRFP